ncbi:hypothetical protein Naga_102565g1 [Nannochloropsis gaditana]|uniref:Uncharacterized protein n=1 Tax=Nannochloropsis gaditana TaxID=72520 RepID=W7TK67_9STRA|nr:hypothetical protein Naga_102565g1 [Nannochloropsis gaditana]
MVSSPTTLCCKPPPGPRVPRVRKAKVRAQCLSSSFPGASGGDMSRARMKSFSRFSLAPSTFTRLLLLLMPLVVPSLVVSPSLCPSLYLHSSSPAPYARTLGNLCLACLSFLGPFP